jgi:hypothetical protein
MILPLHHPGISSLSSFQKAKQSFCRCPGLHGGQSSVARKCKEKHTQQQQERFAQYVTLQKCFSHPSVGIHLFIYLFISEPHP